MNKLYIFTLSLIASLFSFAADWENQYGPASQYTVTLKKMELCTDSSCSTTHTVAEATKSFDIASANIGAILGSYVNTISLPPKGVTYTHLRNTVDRTFTIKGYGLSADGSSSYCYTNGSAGSYTKMTPGTLATTEADAIANATATSVVSVNHTPSSGGYVTAYRNGSDVNITFTYSSSAMVDGDNMLYVVALDSPYTYTGKVPVIDVSFGTQTAVTSMEAGGGDNSNDCNIFPGDPNMRVVIK